MDTTKLPSVEDALKLFEARRELLIKGPASLCVPYETYGNVTNRTPFTYTGYPYHKRTGYLGNEDWHRVFDQKPGALIPVNPFQPSAFRKGLAIWDAAVGIGACRDRNPHHALHVRETPITKGGNKYWETTLVPAINKIGPLGPRGKILRPVDPYIVDLTRMAETGYRIRLAAHALAHQAGDHLDGQKESSTDRTKLGNIISSTTAEIVFAYMYGLPFYTGLVRNVSQYGIVVKSTTHFEMPILRIPWMTEDAPVFDDTIAIVDMSVFLEPHPYGWTAQTMEAQYDDHWCCSPTIVMMAGWELVDFITHQPLTSSRPGAPKAAVGYGLHPMDLQGPDSFWSYLTLAREARGEPIYTKELRDVREWLYSKDFDDLINRYPPLPCYTDCMTINERAEGAPKRPRELRPFKPRDNFQLWRAWERYDKDLKQINGILEEATKERDASYYGSPLVARRQRRMRRRAYNKTLELVQEERTLKRALLKNREGKDLTPEEFRLWTEHAKR